MGLVEAEAAESYCGCQGSGAGAEVGDPGGGGAGWGGEEAAEGGDEVEGEGEGDDLQCSGLQRGSYLNKGGNGGQSVLAGRKYGGAEE